VIGTDREPVAVSLAARAAASNRSMKISASMAVLPWLLWCFVGGVVLAVQILGGSGRYGPPRGADRDDASAVQSLKPRTTEKGLRAEEG
jgi:hypothetical protein